ncbi:MAG: hypothetical protein ABIQ16_00750 [Polyangiaceae bacterium]
MSQFGRFFGFGMLAICPVVACSVINSYDDVVPLKGEGGVGNAGAGGAGGAHSGASGGSSTIGGDNAGAGEAGETSSGGSSPGVPVKGLLIVAGTDPTHGDMDVVSIIDPTSGHELARQTIDGAAVVGLAYDGATGKDVWFEFTGASFPAAPTSKAALTVFGFADLGSKWKAVSSKAVPGLPPPRPDTFVVLNDRLAYLSYTIVAGAPIDSLTVLDTTDPTAVTAVKFDALDFGTDTEVLGIVGTRGVLGDATATGGTLAIVVGAVCNGKKALRACGKVQLLPVTVGDDVSQGVPVDFVTTLVGEPAFASAQSGQLGYVAYTAAANTSVRLKHFDPRNLSKVDSGTPAFQAPWLGGLAYAECQDVALFTGVSQGNLFAASPAGLTGARDLGHSGQSVVYEPYTQHAITLYNPANSAFENSGFASGDAGAGGASNDEPALDSFDVTKNAALVRTLAAKWDPPKDLAPNLAVARFPVAYECK